MLDAIRVSELEGSVVRTLQLSSQEELLSRVKDSTSVVLVPSQKHWRETFRLFWLVDWYSDGNLLVKIAVLSERHGILPQVLVWPDYNFVFVAVDSCIARISHVVANTQFFQFESTVYEMLPFKSENCLVVVYETGVVAIDAAGSILWRYSCDIVESYLINENSLEINEPEDHRIILDIKSGTEIKVSG